jgi:hypothetical protein
MGSDVISSSRHLFSPLFSQHPVDSAFVNFADDCAGAEVSFELRGFLGLNVGCFSMMTFDLTGTGESKSLGSRSVGLDLWHFISPLRLSIDDPAGMA